MTDDNPHDQERLDFEQTTADMALIGYVSTQAPEAHKDIYAEALLKAYGKAIDFLCEHSELVAYYGLMEQFISNAQPDYQVEARSLLHLKRLQNAGYVPGYVELETVPEWRKYTPQDFAAYHNLFASVVNPVAEPKLPVVADERPVEIESHVDQKEAFGEEVNILEVIEHLERSGLEPEEIAFVRQCLAFKPVSLEEIRRQEWDLQVMDEDEFKDFSLKLYLLRARVSELLNNVRVPNKWMSDPKSNQATYQLIVGKEALKRSDDSSTDDPEASLPVERPRRSYRRRVVAEEAETEEEEPVDDAPQPETPTPEVAEPLTDEPAPLTEQSLMQHYREPIRRAAVLAMSESPKTNLVAKRVAEKLGLSVLEVKSVLTGLKEEGVFYAGKPHEGSATLSLSPIEARPTPQGQSNRQKRSDNAVVVDLRDDIEPKDDQHELTPNEMSDCVQIFDALIKQGHQNKGLQLSKISEILGEEGRQLVSLLVRRGGLRRELGWARSRSPHSRKKQDVMIRFPDQAAWNRYKQDPVAYLSGLRQAPSATANEA